MEKWLSIALIGVFGSMFGSLAYTSKVESDCKMAFAQSDKTAEDILKLCKSPR